MTVAGILQIRLHVRAVGAPIDAARQAILAAALAVALCAGHAAAQDVAAPSAQRVEEIVVTSKRSLRALRRETQRATEHLYGLLNDKLGRDF